MKHTLLPLTRRRVALIATLLIAVGCGLFRGGLNVDLDAGAPVDATIADTNVGDEIVSMEAGDANDASDAFDATGIDAAEVCPARCADAGVGRCDPNGTCAVDCIAASTCTTTPIVCPPGIPCKVTCAGAGSCTSTIDCTAASSCTIDCIGGGSCTGRIRCSGSTCTVNCTGIGTCTQGVCCDAGSCDGSPPPVWVCP